MVMAPLAYSLTTWSQCHMTEREILTFPITSAWLSPPLMQSLNCHPFEPYPVLHVFDFHSCDHMSAAQMIPEIYLNSALETCFCSSNCNNSSLKDIIIHFPEETLYTNQFSVSAFQKDYLKFMNTSTDSNI